MWICSLLVVLSFVGAFYTPLCCLFSAFSLLVVSSWHGSQPFIIMIIVGMVRNVMFVSLLPLPHSHTQNQRWIKKS